MSKRDELAEKYTGELDRKMFKAGWDACEKEMKDKYCFSKSCADLTDQLQSRVQKLESALKFLNECEANKCEPCRNYLEKALEPS